MMTFLKLEYSQNPLYRHLLKYGYVIIMDSIHSRQPLQ